MFPFFPFKGRKNTMVSLMKNPGQTFFLPLRGKKKNQRIFEIDFLRGFDIGLMIALHACYLLSQMTNPGFFRLSAGLAMPQWVSATAHFGNQVFALIDYGGLYALEYFFSGLFMFLCGISCAFSHNNAKRAVQLSFVSLAMTIFLEFADVFFLGYSLKDPRGIHIYLGILQSLALILLLYSLIDAFFPSFWVDYGVGILFVILNGITLSIAYRNGSYQVANLPEDWWQLFLGTARFGDDYFSPINTGAQLFLGATVGKTLYRQRKSVLPAWLPTAWAKPLLFLGNHSLVIYLFHMPAVYVILLLIMMPFGFRLPL